MDKTDAPRPLDGLLCLDLTRILAGPYCTMMLGQLGARIVKIERPGRGDDTRGYGPPFVGTEAAYYLSCNSDKESVVLDLRNARARELALQIADRADVLVENFRPGAADRLGFGWEATHARNPRLVYCSISGFGQAGLPRWSRRGGYDLIAQGMGGLQSLTGPVDGAPYKLGTSIADLTSGMYAIIGILAALHARERTGRGQHVDVSMLDGQVNLLSYHAQLFWAGQPPTRMGNAHPNITPYETYAAADGHFNIAIGTDAMWRAFCDAAERPDLRDDPRFTTNSARVENRVALAEQVRPLFTTRTVDQWLELCERLKIPAGRLNSVGEAVEHEQVHARGTVRKLPHPTVGEVNVVGPPFLLSDTPAQARTAPPTMGQHTDTVLKELCGLDEEALAKLREEGAIA